MKKDTKELSDEELIDLYLSLSGKEREKMFADTARAAEIAGVSQRTIQMWIELGMIRVVRVGKKYKIYMESLRERLYKQAG